MLLPILNSLSFSSLQGDVTIYVSDQSAVYRQVLLSNYTKMRRACRSVWSCAVFIRNWLHVEVPIALVLRCVACELLHERAIVLFYLSLCF